MSVDVAALPALSLDIAPVAVVANLRRYLLILTAI